MASRAMLRRKRIVKDYVTAASGTMPGFQWLGTTMVLRNRSPRVSVASSCICIGVTMMMTMIKF
ncbi:hypothetical protein Pyn_35964 [Prunus yedoensis var. nudiflora]|uniref:Uncharacterized protein n=1 Tax=Prunus yedoensis var. nudiflora TaxID=2094558 RepID=A0A314UAV1_PRUYE|nr:hypothetical protein Pyn_35964 [Prunus yedoensis var. nudiflora]